MGRSKCVKCDNECTYEMLGYPPQMFGRNLDQSPRIQYRCGKCGLIYTNTTKPLCH